MKLKLTFVLILLFYKIASTQNMEKIKVYDGAYHMMKAEHSLKSGKPKTIIKNIMIEKLNAVFKSNESVLLVTFECETCKQSVYKYKVKESERLGNPVFCNYKGLCMIAHNNESFIIVNSSQELGFDLSNLNFCSKNKEKVINMTNEKLLSISSKSIKNQ